MTNDFEQLTREEWKSKIWREQQVKKQRKEEERLRQNPLLTRKQYEISEIIRTLGLFLAGLGIIFVLPVSLSLAGAANSSFFLSLILGFILLLFGAFLMFDGGLIFMVKRKYISFKP